MSDTTITALNTTLLHVPWVGAPPANGIMPPAARQLLVLDVATKGGLTGMGYLQTLAGGLETLDACIHEMVAPKVLGRDATEIEGIWRTLWQGNYWLGRAGITVMAQSALDIALWDVVGKRAWLPLYRLWGKARDTVPVDEFGAWRETWFTFFAFRKLGS